MYTVDDFVKGLIVVEVRGIEQEREFLSLLEETDVLWRCGERPLEFRPYRDGYYRKEMPVYYMVEGIRVVPRMCTGNDNVASVPHVKFKNLSLTVEGPRIRLPEKR